MPAARQRASFRYPAAEIRQSGWSYAVSECRDNQPSVDTYINGIYNGTFTNYFCKSIRDGWGAMTRAEILKLQRDSLKYKRFDHVP